MAEVLGAVASGLAVAEVGLKVGGTVWKLRQLWKQVHEVPETIRDLTRQIEMMDPILSDHESTFGVESAGLIEQVPIHPSSATMLSGLYFREALDDLRRLVGDLDGAIESEKKSKRTFARMRVVLKKDTLKEFQHRLARALSLLQCTQINGLTSNTIIANAMITNIWNAVTDMQQKLSNNDSSRLTGKPSSMAVAPLMGSSREHILNRRKETQRQGHGIYLPWSTPSVFGAIAVRSHADDSDGAAYAVRFQLPKWLCQKAWDLCIKRACSGWQASLSIRNVVSEDSPGMICIRTGNLNGLLELYKQGLASPHDCTATGLTMPWLACSASQTEIVEYFIRMNLDHTCFEAMDELRPCMILTFSSLPMEIRQQLVTRGLMDGLVDTIEDIGLLNGPMTEYYSAAQEASVFFLISVSYLPAIFELCFQKMFPLWRNLPPNRKQEILMMEWALQYQNPQALRFWVLRGFRTWPSDALRLLLSPDSRVLPGDVQTWIGDGASILHQVFLYFLRPESCTYTHDWGILLKEAIEASEDVHHRLQVPYVDFLGACSALELATVSVLGQIFTFKRSAFDMEHEASKWSTHRFLNRTMVKLQRMMSILASCGHDLLEFGRREATTWLVERFPERNPNVGNTLYLGIGDQLGGFPYIRAVHYGSDPKDWYFEIDFHYEDYAGEFWNLLENPHLYMVPGAWIDEE